MVSDQEKGVAPALVHVCCETRWWKADLFLPAWRRLRFIVKQPGAVSGSVETEGEEGREVERQAALIRSTETPLPPTPPSPALSWQQATVTFPVNDSC